MRYTVLPVVHADELNKALALQYQVEFDVRNLFWDYFTNDTCMRLEYGDYPDNANFASADEVNELKRRVVCGFLRDIFPNYTEVIIDVSW